jgi:hypothetical protein
MKYSLWGQYLPAGAITAGYTNVIVFVNIDPNQLYLIQSDVSGTITQAHIGLNLDMNVATGSATTGLSTISAIGSTVAATLTFPLRIVDLVNQSSIFGGGLSAPGDAYTDVIVRWNECTLSLQNQTGV